MKNITIKITGTSAILVHSDRLANPLDPLGKKLKELTSKRKKTDADHEMIARLEWEGGLYHDAKIGPYLPGRMIKAMLIRGGTKTKEAPKIKTGVVVMTDRMKLAYSGPREIDALWAAGTFTDMRSVVVQRARLMRCRPIFPEWSVVAELVYDEAVIDKASLLQIANTAGALVGMGDFRPEKGGDFGRFEVEEVKA